jgi:multiple sugar transport system substrate-binding protein
MRWSARRAGSTRTVALLLLLLLFLLAGCGRQQPEARPPVTLGYGPGEPPVTISFWYMPNGASPDQVMRREIDRFHGLHPNITVKATKLDWADALTRLTTAAASGSGPDASQLGTTWVGSISSLGGLRPFSEDELAWLGGRDAYLPASWTSSRLLGRAEITAVPWFVDIRAIFYRTDVLRDHGIDPAGAFADWGSFATTLDQIGRNEQLAALGQPGKADWNVVHNVAPFVWDAGGDFLSADGTRATVATPAVLDGVNYYQALVARYNSREVLRGTYAEARQAFIDGRVAVLTDAPESVATFRASAKLAGRWATAPMPAGPRGRFTFLGGSDLSVWKSSKHSAAALEWIRYLTGEESQRRYVSGIGLWPALLSATGKAPFGSDPAYRAFTAQIPNGRQYPAVAAWNGIEVALHKAFGIMWDRVLATGRPLDRRDLENLLNRATTDVQQAITETG